jgi:uncharacterized membrane protein
MTEKKTKGLDEIYCRSCGEVIKKEAEICPHCGVRNMPAKSPSLRKHDPTQYSTSVSGNWYYGIILCTILWIALIIFLPEEPGDSGTDLLLGFGLLLAWACLPISLYFDIQYVRGNNEKWNPDTALWVIGGFIWVLNLIVVLVYLIRRRESMS